MAQSEVCFEYNVFITLFAKMPQPNMWNMGLYNLYCSNTLKGYFGSQNLVNAALSSNCLLKYDWLIYETAGILCSTKRILCSGIIYFKN